MNLNDNFFKYLTFKIEGFKKTIDKSGRIILTCPNLSSHHFKTKNPTATIIADKIVCPICNFQGDVYGVVRTIEPDLKEKSDAEITQHLISFLGLDMYKELDGYVKYRWSLCACLKNTNKTYEDNWRKLEYRDKIQWTKWLNNGLNIGVNCELSGIMGIDIDCKKPVSEEAKPIREEIIKLLEQSNTLKAITPSKGNHYIFLWEEELRNPQFVNLAGTGIDSRTEGQLCIAPSIRDGKEYEWVNLGVEIKKMPEELKQKLLSLIEVDKGRKDKIDVKEPEIEKISEGEGRNNLLVTVGGSLINKFNPEDTTYILSLISKNFFNPPLPYKEIKAMIGSLSGYKKTEEETKEQLILDYCQAMKYDLHAQDIMASLKLERGIIDKYLSKFFKEGVLIRSGVGRYEFREPIDWEHPNDTELDEYEFKVPFFHQVAHFCQGSIILIGGLTGHGKTHQALNIIKEMVKQGVKPFYVPYEAGSNYKKIASYLDLKSNEYFVPKKEISNPFQIIIPKKSFIVVDWLYLGDDFAATPKMFNYFREEMTKQGGILVLFTQLKEDGSWFAKNMIKDFVALSAKYIFDDDSGKTGYFDVDKIRDSKRGTLVDRIECEFDKETKIFKTKDLI